MITVHPTKNGASDYYAYDHRIMTSIPLMKLSTIKHHTEDPTPMVYRIISHPEIKRIKEFGEGVYAGVYQSNLYIFYRADQQILFQVKDGFSSYDLTEQNDNFGPEIPEQFSPTPAPTILSDYTDALERQKEFYRKQMAKRGSN